MAKHLQGRAEVIVSSRSDRSKEAEALGAKFVSLEEAAKADIVIPSMPMEKLEEVLLKIKPHLKPGAIVIDVCSLKVFSCRLMDEILPENVEVIGTHPLFGPQTASDNLEGQKVALCNVRCKEEIFNKLKELLEVEKLKVFIVTPEEHDKQMAESQALSHFIGQTLKKIDFKHVDLSTRTCDYLFDLLNIIKNHPAALFNNMQTMNPFAKEKRDEFIRAAEDINKELEEEAEK